MKVVSVVSKLILSQTDKAAWLALTEETSTKQAQYWTFTLTPENVNSRSNETEQGKFRLPLFSQV